MLSPRGIVAGNTITKRLASLFRDFSPGRHGEPLRTFLARANQAVRGVFHGPITYSALLFEDVE
jgi:hypothetical protein